MAKIKFLKLLIVFCFMSSCTSQYPDDVELVLNKAGENKEELIKAIDHFKTLGDDKKIEAVYYLIAGMNNKYSYTGETYDILNKKIMMPKLELDSLSLLPAFPPHKIRNIKKRKVARVTRDLMKQSGQDFEKIEDCKIITSDYIIKNVEQAFEAWSMPWSKHVGFDQFCEYILPYKIGDEVIMDWRAKVLEDYTWVKDNMANSTLREICIKLNDTIRYKIRQDISLNYPIDFDYDAMKFLSRGSCGHTTRFAMFVMRGLGVPVSKETSSFLNETSHAWGALHTKDSIIPFEASTNKYGFDLMYEGAVKKKHDDNGSQPSPYRKIVKVERFVYNSKSMREDGNININKDKYDVTSQYVDVSDVELDVEHSYFKNKTYALSSFNRQSWKPTFFSGSRTGKVLFKNLAKEVIYLPQVINETSLLPSGFPFLVQDNGIIKDIKLNKNDTQDIILTRKYPMHKRIKYWSDVLVGSRFQVANSIDFKDSLTIDVIKESPVNYYQDIITDLDSKYQYFRILFPYHSKHIIRASIAEIKVFQGTNTEPYYGEFIGENVRGKISQVFDGKHLTYAEVNENTVAWMGMDFGKPININKISYLQRTDLNMIVPGNTYELVYWDNKWVSLGTQIATGNELVFKDVPKSALFLLHNLTEGKEERIFLYENGEQVFY